LLEMINKVDFAVSLDETRYVLTGMYMKGTDSDVVVVGTDGFRLSLYRKDVAGLKGFKGIIIPRRSTAEIERVIEEDEEVKISISDKHVQFSTNSVTLISRILEGSFPDFENVIPESNVNVLKVDKESIFKGLKKVSAIIGRSEPVKISLHDNLMDIEAESEIGRAKETIEVDYTGENISLNFNVRFVIDVVSHIDGENIIVKAPTAYGAVLFEGENGVDYKNIIMPIRL